MSRSAFLVILLITVSCTPSETFTESEKAEVIKAGTETLDNYYNDIRKEGLKAEFKYLDNSKDFFWVPPGYNSPLSYDSVASILNANALLYKSIDNSFDTLSIIALSKQFATYTGRLRSVMTDTAGKTATYAMIETGILIKRKDGWKLLSGQTSMLTQ